MAEEYSLDPAVLEQRIDEYANSYHAESFRLESEEDWQRRQQIKW